MSNNTTYKPQPPGCYNSWLVTSTSSSSPNSTSLLLAVTCIFETVSTLLNISVFLALLRLRRYNSNRHVGILLNLVVTDLMYNLTAEFLYIVHLGLQSFNMIVCQIVVAIGWFGLFLCLISFFMLVLATVERYIAVFYPFKYLTFVNSKISLAAIASVYLLSITATLMFRLSSFSYAAGITVLILLLFGGFVLVFAFARVFWLSHKIGKEMHRQKASRLASLGHASSPKQSHPHLTVQHASDTSSMAASPRLADAEKKRKFRIWHRDRKNAFLIAFLLGCLVVCYLPYLVGVSLFAFAKGKVTVSKELLHWLWSIMLINATINPLFFFYFDREIRYHIFKVFGCCQTGSSPETSMTRFLRSSVVKPSEVDE